MNRNLAIAIGIIAVIGLAGVVMVPALFPPTTGMAVTFYDADGNVVWQESTEPWSFAITSSGSVVSTAGVTITYVVSADGEVTDISVVGELVIGENSAKLPWTVPRGKITAPLSSNLATDTFNPDVVVLSDLLQYQGSQDSIEYGWHLNFEVTLTVTAKVDGIEATKTWTDFVRAQLYWQVDTKEVTIDGTISPITFG